MKKTIATILLCSAALSTTASAADFINSAPTTPFYAGVQVGNGFTILGGAQIDKTFAVELNHTPNGNNGIFNKCGMRSCNNNYDNYRYSSFGVFGVALLPMNLTGAPGWSLFGKVGVVSTSVDYRWNGNNYSDSYTGLGLGGGAQYDFSKRMSARAGLDLTTGSASNHYNNLYIGAIVKF